jgi:hypothetical protein
MNFEEADQMKLLIGVIGAMWAIIMSIVWRSYDAMSKKLDRLFTNLALNEKDLAVLKNDVQGLREWRHSLANEEHREILKEIRARKQRMTASTPPSEDEDDGG